MHTRHLKYGTPIQECVDAFPKELSLDAVGLWQVVNTLKRGYELQEPDLSFFVRRGIEALLKAGAVPVIGSSEDKMWHRASGFKGEEANVVDQVLHYLQSLDREPTVGDLWFALPQFVAGTSDA